jgi:LPXTG-motif cell wall-anchored protein
MRNIKVTDTLPPFLKLIFFPGTYNSTDNKIEWTIDELNAGNSQEFLIRAKIDKATEVTALTKETNVALASVDEINEKDDATYYIGKGNVATESAVVLPETGSLALVFETIGVIGVGLSGLALRKKVRGY